MPAIPKVWTGTWPARIRDLSGILDQAQFDDLVVDTSYLDAQQVAAKIHHLIGWG